MEEKYKYITHAEVKSRFPGDLAPGQGRSWRPEGSPFLWLEENSKQGDAEVHQHVDDVFIVLAGNPIFIIGGELNETASAKAKGELRAKGIKDGSQVKLMPGDTLYVPAGTPHQRQPNGRIFLQVFKMPANK